MRNRNIFFVKSPLQLLNAREALYHFDLSDNDCFLILMGDRKSYQQMARLVQAMGEWQNVILLNQLGIFSRFPWSNNVDIDNLHEQRKRLSQSSFFTIMRLNRLAESAVDVENVFIGDNNNVFMRHFVNTIKHEQTILLDDGTATLDVARQRIEGNKKRSSKNIVKKVKLVARRMFQGMKDQQPEKVSFFTAYDIEIKPPDKIIQNDFSYIRKKTGELTSTNSVYFLGSPLSEVGFISEESYIDQLALVKSDFKNTDFVYVAHRRESTQKLDKIRDRLGIKIELFDYPVEYQFAVVGPLPGQVVSFFSSALDSLHRIMGDKLEIISYRLIEGSYSAKERIEPIYQNYESSSNGSFKVRVL